MAMGKKPAARPGAPLWVTTADLPTNAGHPFFERLNRVLDEAGFDAFVEGLCAVFYATRMGRPSLRPGRYFRMLFIGYFEGLSVCARSRECPQAGADPGGCLQHRDAPAAPDRHRYAPEPAGAGFFGDFPPDRPPDRPLGASDASLGPQMDTAGARRLNYSSPSGLNSRARRTDFYLGLLGAARGESRGTGLAWARSSP